MFGALLGAADEDVVDLATTVATAIKDTALGVITAVAPLGIAVWLSKRAIGWAKSLAS